MIDYQVRLLNFPSGSTGEAVAENEDGTYTIFIDAALSYEMQLQKFYHAMNHIAGEDFTKENIQEIELDAHSA